MFVDSHDNHQTFLQFNLEKCIETFLKNFSFLKFKSFPVCLDPSLLKIIKFMCFLQTTIFQIESNENDGFNINTFSNVEFIA